MLFFVWQNFCILIVDILKTRKLQMLMTNWDQQTSELEIRFDVNNKDESAGGLLWAR